MSLKKSQSQHERSSKTGVYKQREEKQFSDFFMTQVEIDDLTTKPHKLNEKNNFFQFNSNINR